MNEHKNIITIEDEIKEFSDKPVKSSAIHKALGELEQATAQAIEEHGVPDATEASVGDVLTKGEGGIGWSAPSGGGDTLYEHSLRIYWQGNSGPVFYMYSVIVNKTQTAFTSTSLKNWLQSNRLRGSGAIASGGKNTAIDGHMIEVSYLSSEAEFKLTCFSTSTFSELTWTATGVSVSDTVIAI